MLNLAAEPYSFARFACQAVGFDPNSERVKWINLRAFCQNHNGLPLAQKFDWVYIQPGIFQIFNISGLSVDFLSPNLWITLLIVALTYVGVALSRFPPLRSNRTTIALVGVGLTLLGSVANLIVAESAARRNVRLGFWEYTRAGIIITLFSMVISVVWISLFLW